MKTIVGFLLIGCVVVKSRNLTRCELVNELLSQGFPKHQLRDWVCLIEAESSRRTNAVGGPDDDGSFDFGLFQINDRYWCDHSRPGKGCRVLCKDLHTDDITKASYCTKIIYHKQGFEAWVGWANECRAKPLPAISYCIDGTYL